MNWQDLYSKKDKPRLSEIKAFMSAEAFVAFEEFNRILLEKYSLAYVQVRYSNKYGWYYSYGRSGYLLVYPVTFSEECFTVLNICVHSIVELSPAINLVDKLFNDGFLIRYAEYDEARKKRVRQKKAEKNPTSDNKYKKNCKWCDKVSRSDLTRLYSSDANGMLDTDLLDDIGYTLYTRCKLSKEIYQLLENGQIQCMHCGNIMNCKNNQYQELRCTCGRTYTYHSYRKSYREDNMPRGAASPVFDKFLSDWENAKTQQAKMLLIDNLIHEFHMAEISGNRGRPVGINLIQGTKPQIVKLICDLARKDRII